MNKIGLIALAVVTGGLASAQSLYIPNRSIKDQGIAVKGWGSGTISETDEVAVEGAYSLRVTTKNYFQGGLIDLSTPVDLSGAFGDKNNLLRLAIRSSGEPPKFASGGGKGGNLNPSGNGGRGGGAGAEGGGGGRGGGAPQNPPGRGGQPPATTLTTDAVLKTIRLVITTTDNLKSEAYVDVKATGPEDWRSFSLPLTAINGFSRTNKTIRSIAISGDALSTFWVGDIRVVNDTTPVTGEMNYKDDMNLALGDEREFVAYGFAGSTPLKYTWDFNDADGIQVDAEGQSVKFKFRKPGTFKVTLTVSDAYGAKKPYTTSVKVTINP